MRMYWRQEEKKGSKIQHEKDSALLYLKVDFDIWINKIRLAALFVLELGRLALTLKPSVKLSN